MSHLISFQFILQFTVIYIFAVSGALVRVTNDREDYMKMLTGTSY